MAPLRLLAVAWSLGVVLGAWLDDGDPLAVGLRLAMALAAVAGLILVSGRAGRLGLFVYAAAVAAQVAAPRTGANTELFDGSPWTYTAVIDGPPRPESDSIAVRLAIERAGTRLPDREAVGRFRARLVDQTPGPTLGPGDTLVLRARAFPPGLRCNFGACDGRWRAAADDIDGTLVVGAGAGNQGGQLARADAVARGTMPGLWRLRLAMHGAIDARLPAADAALVAALVTGDRGGVSPDEEAAFRAAGVTHLLSVSGLHLAFAAGLLFGAARWMLRLFFPAVGRRRPRDRIAVLLALPIVVLYTLLTGAEVATIRAALVVAHAFFGLAICRRLRGVDALAFAALAILVPRPASLLDPSFQLSFVAALALLGGRAPISVAPDASRARRLATWVLRLGMASLAATLATAPVTALHFGEIAPAGIVSNLVAVPLTELLIVPLGLVASLLCVAGVGMGGLLLVLVGFFASVLRAFVAATAALTPVLAVPAPSKLVLVVSAVGLVWIGRATAGRQRRLAIVALGLGFCIGAEALSSRLWPSLEITFADVGQGDAAVLRLPDGRAVIIDGGGGGRADPGAQVLVPYLKRLGIRRLAIVVLSHPHADHAGGLAELLRRYPVEVLWTNGQPSVDPAVRALLEVAAARGVPVARPHPIVVGGVAFDVLGPRGPSGEIASDPLASENDNSLVLRLRWAGRTVLFPGDAEAAAEEALVATRPPHADVLKVPHHGSRTSSSAELLDALRPRIAVASLAAGNRFRFPHPEVVARYREHGVALYRTDRDGAVRVKIDADGSIDVRCARPGGCRP